MSDIIKVDFYNTPVGELIIGSYNDELCLCDWRYRKMRTAIDNRIKTRIGLDYEEGGSDIIIETKAQLNQYFKGERTEFDIPLNLVGSEFQVSVWNSLISVPYGNTLTYLDLSKKLGNEKAIRAVASANVANAISIIVPCHRIIGSDGSMVGYAGGVNAKMKLLKLENAIIKNQLSLF